VGCQSDDSSTADDGDASTFGADDEPTSGADEAWREDLPQGIRDFLVADPDHPFGEPADDAPTETDFFARLTGVWDCRLRVTMGTQSATGWPSTWAFKYSPGGYAIEHLYLQEIDDLVPPWKALQRDSQTVALIAYDPATETYGFVSASNFAGVPGAGPVTSITTGKLAGDEVTFQPAEQPDPALSTRDTFFDIESDGFLWRQEESRDQGTTWTEAVRVICSRHEGSPIP
jgi:hypothetical protein